MDQGLVTFPSLENNIGGEFEFSRGVTPSSCRIWIPARPSLTRTVGTLMFQQGGTQISFPNAAIAPGTLRVLMGRNGFIWTVIVRDRRWKWRYPKVTGEYNVRACNGQIKSDTKKTLKELLGLLFTALGETTYQFVNVPDSVYPYVNWKASPAASELAHLAEMYGCIPLLGLDNIARVERLGTGATLPTDTAVTPTQLYEHAIIPSAVKAIAGPTLFQTKLALEAVGLDLDGSIKLIDDLSYKPSGGWASQWYTLFDDARDPAKPLAFNTVFRWYRVKGQATGSWNVPGLNVNISSLDQILPLQTVAAEAAGDPQRCLAPVVRGKFWPLGDFKDETNIDTQYAGPFNILPDKGIVEFEYPVIRWHGPSALEAELYLTAAYAVRGTDGNLVYEEHERPVPEAATQTAPRTDKHFYMRRVRVIDSVLPGGSPSDNIADIQTELQLITKNVAATYAGLPAEDMLYVGLRSDIDLDGAIAQLRFRSGRGIGASTRASRNAEFAIFAPDYQARRRIERLTQVSDEVLE